MFHSYNHGSEKDQGCFLQIKAGPNWKTMKLIAFLFRVVHQSFHDSPHWKPILPLGSTEETRSPSQRNAIPEVTGTSDWASKQYDYPATEKGSCFCETKRRNAMKWRNVIVKKHANGHLSVQNTDGKYTADVDTVSCSSVVSYFLHKNLREFINYWHQSRRNAIVLRSSQSIYSLKIPLHLFWQPKIQ